MNEGDDLGNGLTLTFTKGYPEAVYKCDCGRMQHAYCQYPLDQPNGISEETAEAFGWRKFARGWQCPFCSGTTAQLKALFGAELPSNFTDYGFANRRRH